MGKLLRRREREKGKGKKNEAQQMAPLPFVLRHLAGDWGDLCQEDKQANAAALTYGSRLLSAYDIPPNHRLWIITEADRSSTTLLLPQEY